MAGRSPAASLDERPLPSGLLPSALGFGFQAGWIELPAGLVTPSPEDGAHLLRSLDGPLPAPAWWRGRAERRRIQLALSFGALGLNRQVLPLLRSAESVAARGLAVIAPFVTDEALATLLVNDIRGVFVEGILPLSLQVPEAHVVEALDEMARLLGAPAWDGRPGSVPLIQVEHLRATGEDVRVRLSSGGTGRWQRVGRWLARR